jgi:hypothetical protein
MIAVRTANFVLVKIVFLFFFPYYTLSDDRSCFVLSGTAGTSCDLYFPCFSPVSPSTCCHSNQNRLQPRLSFAAFNHPIFSLLSCVGLSVPVNTEFLHKVVQIWPGLFVCKQVTVCPGHIWTTLYEGDLHYIFTSTWYLFVVNSDYTCIASIIQWWWIMTENNAEKDRRVGETATRTFSWTDWCILPQRVRGPRFEMDVCTIEIRSLLFEPFCSSLANNKTVFFMF